MIRAFTDDDLDAAAALLAERHGRHVQTEPLLDANADFRAEIEALWRSEGASGAVAPGAYILGFSRPEQPWGPNVWIDAAGHAAADPEVLRDVYAAAAVTWVERGMKAHYALVPATDEALVDAWFRLGFGGQQAHGIIEIPEKAWPSGVRAAREEDVDALVALAPFLSRHQQLAPVFGSTPTPTDENFRSEIVEDLGRDDIGVLVAEVDGRIVGSFYVSPVEPSSMHFGLESPAGAALLGFAVTDPGARGSGLGVALTDACFAWARERDYRTMVTDWRVTNLLSSRFWPRRGFRTSFLRLHRLIA